MAQDENSKPEKWSTAYSWMCPYCQLSQPSGTLHVCAGSQRGDGAATESNENNRQYIERTKCKRCGIGAGYDASGGICLTCHVDDIKPLKTGKSDDEITRPGGLRDQFAMAALNGVWADPVAMQTLRAVSKPADDAFFEKIASGCWRIADAMLEARKK